MSNRSSAREHSAVGVEYPPIVCTHPDDVCDVQALDGYRLFVRFFDGVQGIVEMREGIFRKDAGVFASLRDPDAFAQVGIEYGAVKWANGVDIAPDATHADLQRYGAQILR